MRKNPALEVPGYSKAQSRSATECRLARVVLCPRRRTFCTSKARHFQCGVPGVRANSHVLQHMVLYMKKHWIEYWPSWQRGPMTFWVHVEAEPKPWRDAKLFHPPVPEPVPGKGFAVFWVEFDSALLMFSSLIELRTCIDTLSQKSLPSNLILTQKRGANYGPSNHWLNRIPLRSMAWPYRQKTVKYLKTALAYFEAHVQSSAAEPGDIC